MAEEELLNYIDEDREFLSAVAGKMEADFDFDTAIKDAVLKGDLRGADMLTLLRDILPAAEGAWKDKRMDYALGDFSSFMYGTIPEIMILSDRDGLTERFLMVAQAALLVAFLRGWRCAEEQEH